MIQIPHYLNFLSCVRKGDLFPPHPASYTWFFCGNLRPKESFSRLGTKKKPGENGITALNLFEGCVISGWKYLRTGLPDVYS
jgi:hypothetical protein